MTMTCKNGYQIYFRGLDDPEKLKSIIPEKGVITDIIIEEATETKRDDIKHLEKGYEVYPVEIKKTYNF